MSTKLKPPRGSLFTRARREYFAARICTLTAQAARQTEQLSIALNKRLKLEDYSALIDVASDKATHLANTRSRALDVEMQRQLRGLQDTLNVMQSLSQREVSP